MTPETKIKELTARVAALENTVKLIKMVQRAFKTSTDDMQERVFRIENEDLVSRVELLERGKADKVFREGV